MFQIKDDEFIISLHIVPRSSVNEVTGVYGDAVKMKIKSPPVDGKANKAIIGFISKSLRISKSDIRIIKGETGKNKKIGIKSSDVQSVKTFFKIIS